MLATKLYIGNKRAQTKVGHIIKTIDNMIDAIKNTNNSTISNSKESEDTSNRNMNIINKSMYSKERNYNKLKSKCNIIGMKGYIMHY